MTLKQEKRGGINNKILRSVHFYVNPPDGL